MSISFNAQSGFISVSFKHISPSFALNVLDLYTDEIDNHFREKDKKDAEISIRKLNPIIEQTTNSEMRQVFYRMLEGHYKTLLLTEVGENYLFESIVPPMIPEEKDGPKRLLIIFMGGLLGLVFGVTTALLSYFQKNY